MRIRKRYYIVDQPAKKFRWELRRMTEFGTSHLIQSFKHKEPAVALMHALADNRRRSTAIKRASRIAQARTAW